jgi:hypothetical protein
VIFIPGACFGAREPLARSYANGLAFPAGLVLVVVVSVLITAQVANDGRSDWLEGIQLLTIYLVLGLTLFFVPANLTSSH